jgi:glycosyltransferase involved in cell wall biosynthesis
MALPEEITFILPTMNRRQYICRAVESCLACQSEQVSSRVLVIDGMSDDGSYELLRERYAGNPRVRILRYERVGFQRTAYYGAMQVDTPYATFMYDDDLLSPDFHKMFEGMLARGKEFVMGYASIHNVDEVYPFRPIRDFELRPKHDLAMEYFGYDRDDLRFVVPVSPICCIVTTGHLKKWVQFTQEYASKAAIRHYYMIERNIGPDIILYLSAILREDETALVTPTVVGQLSAHPDSMSVGYGDRHLITGYWFGKMWAFEEICRQGNRAAAARSAAFLLALGASMLFRMPFSKDRRWFWSYGREILRVKWLALRYAGVIPLMREFLTTLRNWRARQAHPAG